MHTSASNSVEDVDAIEKVAVSPKGMEEQEAQEGEIHDAVFGTIDGTKGPNYRNVHPPSLLGRTRLAARSLCADIASCCTSACPPQVGWIGTSVLLMKTRE